MLELLLKSTLVLALALVLAACLPKSQPSLRHGVLLSGLLALPLLVLVVLLPPLVALPLLARAPAVIEESPVVIQRAPTVIQIAPPHNAVAAPVLERREPAIQVARPHIQSTTVILGIYCLVLLVLLVRMLRDRYALACLLRRATAAELSAAYPVLLTTQPLVPLACGVARRRILLPHTALSWEPERLQAVLLHESAHLARHDPLCQLLAELVCALFWCHPLVWLVARQLRQEAESACDRHVLANGIAPDRYAHYLLEIVKMLKKQPSAPAMARSSRLETRVHAILGYLPTRPTRSAVLTLALIGVATVPLLAARPAALPQSEAPVKQATPTLEVEKRRAELLALEKEKVRLDKARAAAEKKATKRAPASNKAKLAEEKAQQEKLQRELMAIAQRDRDLNLQRAQKDLQLTKLRLEENIAKTRERQTRDLVTEPLDEELEELKLKLRNLDNRLVDKQLELAEMTESFGPSHERVRVAQRQIDVLTKMMDEVNAKRDRIRARLQEVTKEQRAQQQRVQLEEQEQVLAGLKAELENQEVIAQRKADLFKAGLAPSDELTEAQAKLKEIKARYQIVESRLKQLKG